MKLSTLMMAAVALLLAAMVISCASDQASRVPVPGQVPVAGPVDVVEYGDGYVLEVPQRRVQADGQFGSLFFARPVDGIDSVLLPWDDDADGVPATRPAEREEVGAARRKLQEETERKWREDALRQQRERAVRAARVLPRAGEELWVIARPDQQVTSRDDGPGTGALVVQRESEMVPVPLKHTDVRASIAGYISSTTVKQQFENPFDQKIEAVYVFPLPENAAINEFVMTIGERKIRGVIREREEAEKIYAEARARGHVASLLTQERPNVFTQKVANIEPGKAIDVEVTYYHTLAYADGWYEWVFPMVVGPRYNPSGFTKGVGAAGRGHAGASGQATEVQYLRPGERSGHDIALTVEVNAPVSLEEIECKTHAVQIRRPGEKRAVVAIAKGDAIPNKDFVLRYRVAGETIKTGMLIHRDQRGGYFSLAVYPPMQLKQQQRGPVEMVFLLDVSGSMSGAPMDQSKAAMRYALANMDERDTFQVITFSGNNRVLFERPVPVNERNVRQATAFIDTLRGGGGTEMLPAIERSLVDQPDDRPRFVVFLTDGYVGNELEILEMTAEKIGAGRVFAFGVGSSPNRYLMDGLARVGRGAVAYLGLQDDGAQVMRQFLERVAHPAMTEIRADFGDGMRVDDVYPAKLPDLFVGRPIMLSGRFDGSVNGRVIVHGNVAGRDTAIAVNVDRESMSNPALAAIWARHRITELSDRMAYEPTAAEKHAADVKRTALEYGLMSQYTAFLAVDSSRVTAGDHGVSVAVPVPVPDGVRYETTVNEN